MKASVTPFAPLYETEFVNDVTRTAVRVQATLVDRAPVRVAPEYARDPDEHEFYLLGVGKALVEVLTCCEHLQNIPAMLTSYRETPAIRRVGINRQRHIVYHVESYIIRVQGLFDRALKLLDAVFHLLNDPRNCREYVILKNFKVRHNQSVVAVVKRLNKLLDRYAAQRNEVIHQASFQEDRLRMLEMYYIAENAARQDASFPQRDYQGLIRELSREVATAKKQEFMEFNVELAALMRALLESLYPCYREEERVLRLRVGKPAT